MNPIVYNVSLLVGTVLLSVGAGAQFGWPAGIATAGAIVLGMTIYGARA